MSVRRSFTRTEAAEIRQLIAEKQRADRDRQKAIRAELRRLGFWISSHGHFGPSGFAVSDFDELVQRGTITITN